MVEINTSLQITNFVTFSNYNCKAYMNENEIGHNISLDLLRSDTYDTLELYLIHNLHFNFQKFQVLQ